MKRITLAFKARDLHELTCHFVAAAAGLYADHGLEVNLRDSRQGPDIPVPDDLLTVACGAAAIWWLRGERVKVVFVAADKPMFWLFSHEKGADLAGLRGKRIATYPDAAPPACFLRMALEDAGLAPGRDVDLEAAPDDASRLDMLRAGRVEAALLSSASLPGRSGKPEFPEVLCLGDHLRLPTTGLAVSQAAFEKDRDTIEALGDCFRASLRLVHTDEEILHRALREAHLVEEEHLGRAIALVRRHFTLDGLVGADEILPGIRRLAENLGETITEDPRALYGPVYRG